MPCAPYALHFNVCANFFPFLPISSISMRIDPRLRENIRHDARSWCHRIYDKIIRHMGIACALVVLFLSIHKKNSYFRLNVNICGLICITIIIIIFDMVFYSIRGVWFTYFHFYRNERNIYVVVLHKIKMKIIKIASSFHPLNLFPFAHLLIGILIYVAHFIEFSVCLAVARKERNTKNIRALMYSVSSILEKTSVGNRNHSASSPNPRSHSFSRIHSKKWRCVLFIIFIRIIPHACNFR